MHKTRNGADRILSQTRDQNGRYANTQQNTGKKVSHSELGLIKQATTNEDPKDHHLNGMQASAGLPDSAHQSKYKQYRAQLAEKDPKEKLEGLRV